MVTEPTSNVVELDAYRPHISGEASCLLCSHRWIATAPTGVIWLECPSCGCFKGVFRFSCERQEPHWECLCGNQLFHITEDGIYCPNCGEDHDEFW